MQSLSLPPPAQRLLIELEFVQNLSNPKYLNYLAQHGYFEQESFMNFLEYLQYWKKPEYISHIIFPQALAFLDAIIENPQFRRELALPNFIEFVHQQQGSHWMFVCEEAIRSGLSKEASDSLQDS